MEKIIIGDISIEKVVEIDVMYVHPNHIYHNLDEKTLKKNRVNLPSPFIHETENKIGLSFYSFLIRAHGKNILVDTCNGNHKNRMPNFPEYSFLKSSNYLENLSKSGLSTDDIDIVLSTHLHTDHVGWNTIYIDGEWRPTFKNAKYIWSKIDFEFFQNRQNKNPENINNAYIDSILPIIKEGQAELVDMDAQIVGDKECGVWFEAAPGHTPGHVTVHIKSNGIEAIMTGDIIHHPILFNEPHLETKSDVDKENADLSREKILEKLSTGSKILLAAHFCNPTSGCINKTGKGFEFSFLHSSGN